MGGFLNILRLTSVLILAPVASGQQNCYYGRGAEFRGPSQLVPCNSGGVSACCLLGDTCLSGNACFNEATGNTYQYGCTDITYEHESCPAKCGWSPSRSPWIGLDYCNDIPDVSDTWTCLAPESCACEWHGSYELQILPTRACAAMGSDARVALYAPSTLLAYVSLPSTIGGSTGYYSQTTLSDGSLSVISTAIAGYTPSPFTQFTTYRELGASVIVINRGATPSPSSAHAVASPLSGSIPPAHSSHPAQPTSSSSPTPSSSYSSPSPSSSFSGAPSSPVSSLPASVYSQSTTRSPYATMSSATAGAGHGTVPLNTSVASGLSTDAKIGIGVGAGVGTILVLATFGVCLWRLKGRKKAQVESPPPSYPQSPPMAYHTPPEGPNHWATANTHGMSYYVAAPYNIPEKDGAAINISPPYFPSQSPPPPSELSADQRHYNIERTSFYNAANGMYRSPDWTH